MVCRVSVTSSVVRETRNSPSFAGFPKSSLRLLAGPAPFTGVAVSAGTRRCARSPVQLFRCRVGRGRDSAARVFATTATEKASPWWARQKELWTEVESEEHFYELVEQAGRERKLLLIDFYATWCHACQKVYPTLCLMAEDPKLTKNILFAKLQVDKFKTLVKKEGLTMLPVVRGYGNEGKFLFECSASPKKVKKLRQNLNTVLADTSRSYYEDPMGVLQPETEEMMARKAEKEAELKRLAKEKAALAKTMDNLASNGNGSARSVPRVKELNSKDPSKTQDPRKRMFLEKYKADYGYGGMIDELYQREIGSRLSENEHYMDYTAAALYCNSVIDNAMNELKSAVFGNPHSAAPSSVRTDTKIEAIRERILRHFNADPAEYQCVFTRGATASLKLVGETFPWSDKSRFVYLRENHNSVLGQRQYALAHGASFQAVDEDWVDTWLFGDNSESQDIDESLASPPGDGAEEPVYSLFAFPGEDNFAGVKYPLEWIHGVRAKSTENTKWFSMLDAAAFVHAQPLDLTAYPADFVSISFYKMFGYPTGLGALIIRTENVELLKKVFWGGGSVSLATSADNFHVLKCKPSERLEDGTVSFLDIIALEHGFNMVEKLGGPPMIQRHVASLADYLYEQLTSLRHSNGKPMAFVFGKHDHPNRHKVQGGIVNFELLGSDGHVLSYREIQEAAGQAGFHIRTGAECNPGACYKYLGIQDEEVERLAGTKEGCNDEVEYLTVQRTADFSSIGQLVTSQEILDAIEETKVPLGHAGEVAMKWVKVPLGSIRVSLGYMSTFEDVQALVDWVELRYRDKTSADF